MMSDKRMYPIVSSETMWRKIPGLPNFTISSNGAVREFGKPYFLPCEIIGTAQTVRLDGHSYSVVELMLLTFVGPKPHDFAVYKRVGTTFSLSNLFYGPEEVPEESEEVPEESGA